MMQPAVARFLLALPLGPENARDAAGPALAALSAEREDLARRAPGILQRGPGGELIREAHDLYGRVEELIASLDSSTGAGAESQPARVDDQNGAGFPNRRAESQPARVDDQNGAGFPNRRAGNHIQELREAADLLEAAVQRLDEHERTQPRESPLPVVEAVIVRAVNHRDGFVAASVVEAEIPALIQHVETLGADARRFRRLHPEASSIVDGCEAEQRKMQAGVNALRAWMERREDATLLDALRLLKSGSTGILEPLQQMDAHVRAHQRFSPVVAIEELLACAEGVRGGTIPSDVFLQAVDQFKGTVDFYLVASTDAQVMPLFFAIRPQVADLSEHAQALAAAAASWIERARVDPQAACRDEAMLEQLRGSAESTARAHERVHREIGEWLENFAGWPQLLDAVASLGRVASGQALPEQARRRCDAMLENHQRVQQEISGQPPGTEIFEARALLAEQADALVEMQTYLDDLDESHLRQGLDRLRGVLPTLNGMQRDLRGAAEEQRLARERVVACFRCGSANATSDRYCKACNAVLPAQAPEETVYVDIVGGEEEMPLPANLRALQTIYSLAESGADKDVVAEQLATLHGELQRVTREYEEGFQQRSPQLTREAAEYSRAFAQQLALLTEAVETMYAGAQHASLETMQRGLLAALMAGEEMQGVQQHMQENVAP